VAYAEKFAGLIEKAGNARCRSPSFHSARNFTMRACLSPPRGRSIRHGVSLQYTIKYISGIMIFMYTYTCIHTCIRITRRAAKPECQYARMQVVSGEEKNGGGLSHRCAPRAPRRDNTLLSSMISVWGHARRAEGSPLL